LKAESGKDIWGLVLAAGSGSRFGDRKQFLSVAGQRLVDLSLQATSSVCEGVVLVLPQGCPWDGEPVSAVTGGGETRIESARRGLEKIPFHARIILIHDAAHPLASPALFQALLEALRDESVDAAFPVLPTVDTVVRLRDGDVVETIPRYGLVTVQTPQGFKADVLRAIHRHGGDAADESVLAQRVGAKIRTVPGEIGNIHVTSEEDLSTITHLLGASE
jgi:2-C-methyl-D-erythritol 4-phosphate cytidylyltransferase